MKEREHLPVYGIGPLYCGILFAVTFSAVLLRNRPPFSAGSLGVLGLGMLRLVLSIAGAALILAGIALWIYAVKCSGIDDGILENRLVTTKAYSMVRNPIYSACMLICTGVILLAGNAFFFVLPFAYWLFMTVLLKATEEKWLKERYGKAYEDYCRRVNRCWPWLPGRTEK